MIHELIHRKTSEIFLKAGRKPEKLIDEAFTLFVEHEILKRVFGEEASSRVLKLEKERIKSVDIEACCKLFPVFSKILKFPIFSNFSVQELLETLNSIKFINC